MGKGDEQKQRPYTSGNVIDDVSDWAGKIKALGEVWSALSWHENESREGGGGSQALEWCGEKMGEIIMDYAELIEVTIAKNGKFFIDPDGINVVFPLTAHQNSLKMLYQGAFNEEGTIDHIERSIKELDAFSENASIPAMRLRNQFEDLKKKVLGGPEKAPAKGEAESEAEKLKTLNFLSPQG
jgi:hypothetical protein